VGSTISFGAGSSDAFIIKYDNTGIQQWNLTWGGSNSEMGNGIALDDADNIHITGHTYSFGEGGCDVFIAIYDTAGIQQWNTTWGGIDDDAGTDIALDALGNVYITGETYSFGEGNPGAGNAEVFLVIYGLIEGDDDDSDDDITDTIPGYDLLLIIGIIGLFVIILRKKSL